MKKLTVVLAIIALNAGMTFTQTKTSAADELKQIENDWTAAAKARMPRSSRTFSPTTGSRSGGTEKRETKPRHWAT